jgi:hypothetical protein
MAMDLETSAREAAVRRARLTATVAVLVALATLATSPPAAAATAVWIVPPTGSDETCPSARQVADALQAHLPGQIQSADRGWGAARSETLHALLDVPADGTVVHFSLVDGRGDLQLRRSIPAPGRGRPLSECLALAETLAVIVERYLSSVPYQASETEPPPAPADVPSPSRPDAPSVAGGRSGSIFVGGTWQMSSTTPSLFEANLGGEIELTRSTRPLVAVLRVGADQENSVTRTTVTASLRRFPARFGLLLRITAGPGAFEPALEAGVDLFRGHSTDALTGLTDQALRFSPVVEGQTGYRVALGSHFFVRPRAGLGFAIVRYDVAVGGPQAVVFHTPTSFSSFGLDVGAVFR